MQPGRWNGIAHVLIATALLTACAAPRKPQPTPVAPPPATIRPTQPPAPTVTFAPTDTPAPAVTWVPTATSQPTPVPPTATALPAPETLAIFQQGMQEDAQRYQFAVDQGARFVTAPDGRSFSIVWFPPGTDPTSPPPVIATLHGHGSYAFDEFYLWQPYALERGYGILALQWWLGTGEQIDDYYVPAIIYEAFATTFEAEHVKPNSVLFHGFSRGSANSYGVTAIDASLEHPYFALTIANAGKPGTDFPINVDIANGKFGASPLSSTHWVMVCGEHDPHPDRDGCPGMREARDWVTGYGGVVDLLIEDPDGDHGAFHKNPANVNAALDVFAQRLTDDD